MRDQKLTHIYNQMIFNRHAKILMGNAGRYKHKHKEYVSWPNAIKFRIDNKNIDNRGPIFLIQIISKKHLV